MAEISFYHLSRSPLDKAILRLLEKILANGKRAVVLLDTPERVASMDTALWTCSSGSFLPHGLADDHWCERQPVVLTDHLYNPNGAQILVVAGGQEVDEFQNFERYLDIFNGLDESALEAARKRWLNYRNQGHNLTYWFQNDAGAWEQKQPGSTATRV